MYAARMFFYEDLEENKPVDDMVEDEIDKLFSKLEQMEPPASLLDDILATVAHLPLPQNLTSLDMEELCLNETGVILHMSPNDLRH